MRQKTWVGLFFITAGLIVAFVLSLALKSLFAALRVTDTEIVGERITMTVLLAMVVGALITVGCAMWPKSRSFVDHVIDELYKVNWPTWGETKVNTAVVIVTSVISAIILGAFDISFGWASTWLGEHL
ncbi:MAG: preprotein translocase subunit SecE [Deltaproteobacteria bacterium]|nr:preprotein translocase subunit SecE [Deltaproteobacteria bacterium]